MPRSDRSLRLIEILSPAEVYSLLRCCSRRASTGIRNKALLALLFGSGLRIGEALALHPKDLDLDGLAVTVLSAKGGKRRVAAVLPDVVDVVASWVEHRARLGLDRRSPIFCTTGRGAAGRHPTDPGGKLTREYVARYLRRLAKRAGIEKRVHPHGFRHSHADLLRRRGFDMQQIRAQLGHASLEVTGRYLDHLGVNDLPDRMRKIGPVFEPKPARQELSDIVARLSESDVAQMVALLKRAQK